MKKMITFKKYNGGDSKDGSPYDVFYANIVFVLGFILGCTLGIPEVMLMGTVVIVLLSFITVLRWVF